MPFWNREGPWQKAGGVESSLDKAEVGVQQMGLPRSAALGAPPCSGDLLPHLTTLSTVSFPLPSVSGGLASGARTTITRGSLELLL